ncbi:zinc-ribbon domain-containing protein [bacterium]|nr:zinc-ribbon domain-containing protein [bacterium]
MEEQDEGEISGEYPQLRRIQCPNCNATFALSPDELDRATATRNTEEVGDSRLYCSKCDSRFLLRQNLCFQTAEEYGLPEASVAAPESPSSAEILHGSGEEDDIPPHEITELSNTDDTGVEQPPIEEEPPSPAGDAFSPPLQENLFSLLRSKSLPFEEEDGGDVPDAAQIEELDSPIEDEEETQEEEVFSAESEREQEQPAQEEPPLLAPEAAPAVHEETIHLMDQGEEEDSYDSEEPLPSESTEAEEEEEDSPAPAAEPEQPEPIRPKGTPLDNLISMEIDGRKHDAPPFGEELRDEKSEILYASAQTRDESAVRQMPALFSLFFLTLPLILFVCALPFVSDFLREDSGISRFLRGVVLSELPSPPPPSVQLSQVSFSKIPLLAGGEIFAVQAQLKNESEQNFRRVQVEAALFDENGVLLTAKQGVVGKSLQLKGGLTTVEEALQFQESFGERENDISAGEQRKTILFFTPEEAQRVKHFTARVRSVQ